MGARGAAVINMGAGLRRWTGSPTHITHHPPANYAILVEARFGHIRGCARHHYHHGGSQTLYREERR